MATAWRALFVALVYLAASSFTLQSFLTHWGGKLSAELDSTLTFSQARPYVYRVLSPLIVNGVTAIVPGRLASAMLEGWGRGVTGFVVSRSGCPGPPSLQLLVSTWLMLGALWGAALTWRALVRWAFPADPLLADTMPVLVLLLLPATFAGGGFLYDFPELFLVSACFLAFVQRSWHLFYALLPLAILNKESSALVVTWWLATRQAMPRRVWWAHASATATVGATMVACLWCTFRSRNGYVAQPNFLHNLRYWASFKWLFAFQDAFGTALPFPVAFNVVNLAALWAIWSLGRHRVPPVVAPAFAWGAFAVAPLLLLFGFENEMRVFAVALPPLVVLGAGAAVALYETHGP
jgi:hypothetical protein